MLYWKFKLNTHEYLSFFKFLTYLIYFLIKKNVPNTWYSIEKSFKETTDISRSVWTNLQRIVSSINKIRTQKSNSFNSRSIRVISFSRQAIERIDLSVRAYQITRVEKKWKKKTTTPILKGKEPARRIWPLYFIRDFPGLIKFLYRHGPVSPADSNEFQSRRINKEQVQSGEVGRRPTVETPHLTTSREDLPNFRPKFAFEHTQTDFFPYPELRDELANTDYTERTH